MGKGISGRGSRVIIGMEGERVWRVCVYVFACACVCVCV